MTIKENITTLFNTCCSKPLSITKIQGDASSRQYFRVIGTNDTFIACYDPEFETSTPDTYQFLVMHKLFSTHHIPVPAVKAIDAEKGLLLLEDCGDLLLQNLFGSQNEKTIALLYQEIIDILVQLQVISGGKNNIPFSRSFDKEKLMFEFDFFIEHGLLDYFASAFDPKLIGTLRHEFEAIAELLVQPQHFVLNHRDFHSRNILVYKGKPVIIDFQDARMGLPQYDAVSLIKDSYIKLNPLLTEELKAYHFNALRRHNPGTMSFDEYLYYFDLMAFQRNIKALGTFCYQTKVKKNNAFKHSIAPTLAYLPDYIEARTELRAAGKILRPLLEGSAS
ncbi:MAG: aminoglycoside phosphotransferase family protein [Chlorobium sp.]